MMIVYSCVCVGFSLSLMRIWWNQGGLSRQSTSHFVSRVKLWQQERHQDNITKVKKVQKSWLLSPSCALKMKSVTRRRKTDKSLLKLTLVKKGVITFAFACVARKKKEFFSWLQTSCVSAPSPRCVCHDVYNLPFLPDACASIREALTNLHTKFERNNYTRVWTLKHTCPWRWGNKKWYSWMKEKVSGERILSHLSLTECDSVLTDYKYGAVCAVNKKQHRKGLGEG